MILLTGGTGAIGKNLLVQILLSGDEDILITTRKKQNVDEKHSRLIVEEGDIRDLSFIQKIFSSYKIRAVIHGAWQGVKSNERDQSFQFDNFVAFKELIEQSAKHGCETFIGLGSQAEYGVHNVTITESVLPAPKSLYGLYKLSAGLLGRQVSQGSGMNFAWLRVFASYGPHDHPEFLIPYTIGKFLGNESPELTACEQYWDYLFVQDVAVIIETILRSKKKFNDIYNLSSGKARQLKEIVLIIQSLCGGLVEPGFGKVTPNNNSLYFLEGDNNKLRSAFDIPQLTSIEKGLSLTVEWHKNHGKHSA
jgi:nucleoside-diphosphate-sugar epimerase